MTDNVRCTHESKGGRRCPARPMDGQDTCGHHTFLKCDNCERKPNVLDACVLSSGITLCPHCVRTGVYGLPSEPRLRVAVSDGLGSDQEVDARLVKFFVQNWGEVHVTLEASGPGGTPWLSMRTVEGSVETMASSGNHIYLRPGGDWRWRRTRRKPLGWGNEPTEPNP